MCKRKLKSELKRTTNSSSWMLIYQSSNHYSSANMINNHTESGKGHGLEFTSVELNA